MVSNGKVGALRKLRHDVGLGLREAERRLGVTRGELSRYERGLRRFPMHLVSRMASAYSTPDREVTVTEVLYAAEQDWRSRQARAENAPSASGGNRA